MKFLNERVLIREVAQRWAEQYSDGYWRKDAEKQAIGRKLAALNGETATAADVEAIIGNDSWTRIDHCDECGAENIPAAVRLADATPSSSADICLPCLRKAVRLARGVEVRYWLCCGSQDPSHRDRSCMEAKIGHPERCRLGTASEHSEWQRTHGVRGTGDA